VRHWILGALLATVVVAPAFAQQHTTEADLRRLAPYSEMRQAVPGLTLEQYNRAISEIARQRTTQFPVAPTVPAPPKPSADYLGRLSANPYQLDSTANPYGRFGSPYADTVTNPYSRYGSPYSPNGVTNPYATSTPRLYGQDGKYLGKVSSNPYDPDSISNPYGRYGSRYSPNSVNNPYGRYGSPYSPYSTTNPYATQAPLIVGSPD